MKFIVFFTALAGTIPIGIFLRDKPKLQYLVAALCGFLPFFNVDVNLISYEWYRGDTRGIEVSLVDLIAVILYFSVAHKGVPLRNQWSRWLYFIVCLISIYVAIKPLFATFAVWKVARLYFVGAAVVRVASVSYMAPAFITGMSAGIIYSAYVALKQRYIMGMVQCKGPFEHQNGLGGVANLIFPISLALILAGRGGKMAPAALIASALCVVLSLSRGSMAMFVLASIIVFFGSVARGLNSRKMAVAALGLVAATGVLIKSGDTIMKRFSTAPDQSAHGRDVFEEAARMMLDDKPVGIGMNQYSHVLEHEGYADTLEVPDVDRGGIVHNIYVLTRTELGYQGLIAFLLVHLFPVFWAYKAAYQLPGIHGDVMLGTAAALSVCFLQGFLEWSIRMTPISQIIWIHFGIIATLTQRHVER